MAPNSEALPEGTDTIIPGASSGASDDGIGIAPPPPGTSFTPEGGAPSDTRFEASGGGSIRDRVADSAASLRGQATDKARDWALQGKDRACGALDNVVKLVDDAAGTIDEKIGQQYGDYARQAAQSLSGIAGSLRDKDVDELVRDARDAVRKSPAIAIGAAAAIGFLIARAVKSASAPAAGGDTTTTDTTAPNAPDRPAA